MKHYRLLMGLVVGLLFFECDAALSIAVALTVGFPNFTKHNQGTGTPTPAPSPTSAKAGTEQVATITATLDDSGYISYYITDKWNVPGKPPHDRTHVSKENHSSTLFKTQFDPNSLNVVTLEDGEVQISGTDAVTKETLTWVSSQNSNKDDDVTWTQTQ